MKKALSLILAIVMVAVCVPVVSAYEFAELENAFFDAYCNYYGSYYSVYTKDGVTGEIGFLIEALDEIYMDSEITDAWNSFDFAYGLKNYAENDPEKKLAELTETINKVNMEADKWLAENGYVMVIDASALGFPEVIGAHYDDETNDACSAFMEEKTDMAKYEEVLYMYNEEAFRLLEKAVLEGIDSVTQEEFDAKVKPVRKYLEDVMDCFEGNHSIGEYKDIGEGMHKADCTFCKDGEIVAAHTWGEYISNGDATTESDGTKTARCTSCAATDTVADEGSKLPADNEDENFFSDLIGMLKSFFNRIIELLKSFFK